MSEETDILGISEIRHDGQVFPARKKLELAGAGVHDTGRMTRVRMLGESRRMLTRLGNEDWSWIISGDGAFVGYEASSGNWFGASANADQSGFSEARYVLVSTPALESPVQEIYIQSFASDPIEPRKVLYNIGPMPITLLNGWSGDLDLGEYTQAPSTLRVAPPPTLPAFVLAPSSGVRIHWDSIDHRWIVVSTPEASSIPGQLRINGVPLVINGIPVVITVPDGHLRINGVPVLINGRYIVIS